MLMIDIEGTSLTAEDKKLLSHPKVGGIILFTRNYESPEQLINLTNEIHALRAPPLMIAVDHEGGRVQRFREGFTKLPPMRELGDLYDTDPNAALEKA
jgi:beta-N-acetylhexosaminidase